MTEAKTTKWLVTGGSGLLGHHVCSHLRDSGNKEIVTTCHNHPVEAAGVRVHQIDLLDFDRVGDLIRSERPDVIFHTAALANVDLCEKEPDLAWKYNVGLPVEIAKAARAVDAQMVHITTDQLWAGDKKLVSEDEPVCPINIYGKTKAESEDKLLAVMPEALVLRTNFFGKGRPWRHSFSDWLLQEMSAGRTINGFDDIFYSPVAIDFLVPYALRLVEARASGIFHLAGGERISKYDFIALFARKAGLYPDLLVRCKCDDANLAAPRPKDMSLSVEKVERFLGCPMPTAAESIETVLKHGI